MSLLRATHQTVVVLVQVYVLERAILDVQAVQVDVVDAQAHVVLTVVLALVVALDVPVAVLEDVVLLVEVDVVEAVLVDAADVMELVVETVVDALHALVALVIVLVVVVDVLVVAEVVVLAVLIVKAVVKLVQHHALDVPAVLVVLDVRVAALDAGDVPMGANLLVKVHVVLAALGAPVVADVELLVVEPALLDVQVAQDVMVVAAVGQIVQVDVMVAVITTALVVHPAVAQAVAVTVMVAVIITALVVVVVVNLVAQDAPLHALHLALLVALGVLLALPVALLAQETATHHVQMPVVLDVPQQQVVRALDVPEIAAQIATEAVRLLVQQLAVQRVYQTVQELVMVH